MYNFGLSECYRVKRKSMNKKTKVRGDYKYVRHQPVLSKHLRIIKMCLLKTGACLIQVRFNVFAFFGLA